MTSRSSRATAPLVADPGVKVEYGINTDWLGRVVEAASGVTLDVAIKEGITGPLGMDQTALLMSKDQRDRSVPVHLKGEDGGWAASEIDLNQEPEYWAGGHGLHSTPRDYLTFHRALLAGGTFNGITILEESTVDAAFTNQIGDLDFPEFIAAADPATTEAFEASPDGDGPAAGPGPGCSTPISGSIARPGSPVASTPSSCPS